GFVGANNKLSGRVMPAHGASQGLVSLTTGQGLAMRARAIGQIAPGQVVEAFVRPEAISLARHADELPAEHPRHAGQVESLLFDGANSAVLLREAGSRSEFRIALPQTGQFADLRIGETVAFSYDPQHAVCFASGSA
ncbi:MAG: TOBE domain-containing protein, partial [Polaromonas sp.]